MGSVNLDHLAVCSDGGGNHMQMLGFLECVVT